MATRMQQRRGTAAQWTAADPVLAAGEIGFETDTSKFKIGDGVNTWSTLTYFASATELANIIDGAPALLDTLNELAAAIGDDPNFVTTIQSYADNAVSTHAADSTSVHGITDTSLLATTADITAHAGISTNVHGIPDTSVLATETFADNAATNAATNEVSAHNSDTLSVHGITDTSLLVTTGGATMTGFLTLHADPSNNLHAATKQYVDNIAQGVIAKPSVKVATTQNIAGTYDNGTAGVGATLTATSNGALIEIDGRTAWELYDGILLKDQTNKAENGRYFVSDLGSASTPWVLTRCQYCDEASEIPGAYIFVTGGSVNKSTGWIQEVSDPDTFTVGTDDINVYQFSGAGTYTAGPGLSLNGSQFNIDTTITATVDNPTFTGTVTLPAGSLETADYADGSITGDKIASDTITNNNISSGAAIDQSKISNLTSDIASKANVADPTFTGTVTVSASGITFADGTQTKEGVPSRTTIIDKTESYTLSSLTERDTMIELSSSSALTLTIPADSTVNFPIGTTLDILQTGTGQVTVAGAGGVTVNATPGLKLRTQWSSATLMKRGANNWLVFGDLQA